MPHVVLLGDSIFDNGVYVPEGLPVIEQLRAVLADDWSATLLAVDGDVTTDVHAQLQKMPADASHVVVSCGGNDALGHLSVLDEKVANISQALERFATIRQEFRSKYKAMLEAVTAYAYPTAVCTVYDCVPGLKPSQQAALSMFNEVILREAIEADVALIDLRLVCNEPSDYSKLSPIEPSQQGGEKIVKVIRALVTNQIGQTTRILA
ncbi:MAG: SGNH/GDSL hydrolase family protein [Verrucomicrobiota bacterium]